MGYFLLLWEATKAVLKQKRYVVGLLVVALIVFWLFVYIPVISIPGNDFGYQLSIMPKRDYVVLITLSLLTGLAVMFNLYILSNHGKHRIIQVGHLTFSGLMGLVTSFFGTLTCLSCAATVLGFFGLGTVIFFGTYRFYIASFAFVLMAISLYFTALKVLNLCEECNNLQLKRR